MYEIYLESKFQWAIKKEIRIYLHQTFLLLFEVHTL